MCSYPVISRGDRWAKAECLLTVEAWGELDLEEHMQAILHSLMPMLNAGAPTSASDRFRLDNTIPYIRCC